MFMRFNNKYETIFLDKDSPGFDASSVATKKVNIILSPSLYWVKKVSLPVKYLRDVKKLLPSIFEDTLADGNYSYSAYKSGEEFVLFAYEDKVILDLMNEKKIPIANVAHIYFAQSVLENQEGALKVSEQQSIYIKEGIVLLVPSAWIGESKILDMKSIVLPRHTLVLQQYGHILNSKYLYTIGAVLLAFIVLLGIEYFITVQKTKKIEEAKGELFTKNHLKATMFQNKALLKKYTKIHTLQTSLRETIALLLSLRLKKEQELHFLSFKNKTLLVQFAGVKPGDEKVILKRLKEKRLDLKEKFKDGVLELEIAL